MSNEILRVSFSISPSSDILTQIRLRSLATSLGEIRHQWFHSFESDMFSLFFHMRNFHVLRRPIVNSRIASKNSTDKNRNQVKRLRKTHAKYVTHFFLSISFAFFRIYFWPDCFCHAFTWFKPFAFRVLGMRVRFIYIYFLLSPNRTICAQLGEHWRKNFSHIFRV